MNTSSLKLKIPALTSRLVSGTVASTSLATESAVGHSLPSMGPALTKPVPMKKQLSLDIIMKGKSGRHNYRIFAGIYSPKQETTGRGHLAW